MVSNKRYYVYIMSNQNKILYTGVTNDLERRVDEHKQRVKPGFTRNYFVTQLVFFEEGTDIESAILREKQIKGWLRSKKIALIEKENPEWKDLAEDWF